MLKTNYDLSYMSHISNTLLRKYEKIFISKFSFEGDDNFTKKAQRLFFSTIFNRGYVGVMNNKKYGLIVVYFNPMPSAGYISAYDHNGTILSAKGQPAFLPAWGRTDLFNLMLNNKNCAFFYTPEYIYNQSIITMKSTLEPLCDEYARMLYRAHLNNFIGFGKPILAKSKRSEEIYDQLYSFDPIETTKTSDKGMSDKNNLVDNLMADTNKLFDVLKIDYKPEEMLSAIEKYQTLISKIVGMRYTQTFKKERMVSAEVENENQEFKIVEFFFKETIENFIEDYEKVFGKKLTLIDNSGMDEIEEQQQPEQELEQQNLFGFKGQKGDSNGNSNNKNNN